MEHISRFIKLEFFSADSLSYDSEPPPLLFNLVYLFCLFGNVALVDVRRGSLRRPSVSSVGLRPGNFCVV